MKTAEQAIAELRAYIALRELREKQSQLKQSFDNGMDKLNQLFSIADDEIDEDEIQDDF
jgi:hypothetical protein